MIEKITVQNEEVYLKKSGSNWRVIYPIKINGKIIWKNLLSGGSWWNLLYIFIFIAIIFGLINEYLSNLKLTSACLRALPDYINLRPYLENPDMVAFNLS